MTIELRPLGVACNLACRYCYQQPQRDAGNQRTSYNLEKLKSEALRIGGTFTLFGGEPLLMKFDDLDHLFAWGMEKFGSSSIQTNGVLIEDRHIDLFKRYKVNVGISIDGPDELNDVRWNGTRTKTRNATAQIENVIARLCAARRPPGLIVTLHQGNATADKLPRMVEWMRSLDGLGVKSVRLHLLEVDDETQRESLALTAQQNIEALLCFADAEKDLANIRFDTFRDMGELLMGRDGKTSCVWRACDPYTTQAVQGIEGNGQSSNCGRTNKEGINFVKAQIPGYERYLALFNTPQSENGCAGCRFFLMCKGQCPGTAIDGDWRNRTENCAEWKYLFRIIEKRLILSGKVPLTLQPARLELERLQVEAWKSGRNPTFNRNYGLLLRGQIQAPSDRDAGVTAPAAPEDQKTPVRVSWVSAAARDFWQPNIDKIRTMIEDVTVLVGHRHGQRCAARHVPDGHFHRLKSLAVAKGADAVLLPVSALPSAICTHPGAAESGILLVGLPNVVTDALAAWEARDMSRFHSFLDLPPCCLNRPSDRGASATISAMVAAMLPPLATTIELSEEIGLHPFLAHLGLCVLPVLPCRVDCPDCLCAGEQFLASGADYGYAAGVGLLREILSWALSWSELHGITEVKTPVFKLCSSSGADRGTKRILRAGQEKVRFGGTGLSFPFAGPRTVRQNAPSDAELLGAGVG